MNHHEQAVAIVQKSMDDLMRGKTMPGNEPDDMRSNETNEALEAVPATDDEVIAFVKKLVPKATEVDTIDWDGGDDVQVGFWLKRGDVE